MTTNGVQAAFSWFVLDLIPWVATVHAKVLLLVHGLHVQVGLDPVLFEVNPCVEEDDLFHRPGQWTVATENTAKPLSPIVKHSTSKEFVQRKKISTRGLWTSNNTC